MRIDIIFKTSVDLRLIKLLFGDKLPNRGGLFDLTNLFMRLLLSYDPMPRKAFVYPNWNLPQNFSVKLFSLQNKFMGPNMNYFEIKPSDSNLVAIQLAPPYAWLPALLLFCI